MGSPITLSGYNQIDFSVILNAIMQQERQPVTALETQQKSLEGQKSAFTALVSKLSTLQSAVESVTSDTALSGTAATVSDSTRLSVSSESAAAAGSYEVTVTQLARAQTSTSTQAFADRDTTKVAGAGTLSFTTEAGTVDVTLSGDVTLEELAEAINSADDTPVSASVFRNTDGEYQLMLVGRETGTDNAFTIDTSSLTAPSTGGSAMSFTTVQSGRDAQVDINGVTATSSTNTFDGVIGGVSFTALKEDTDNPVTIMITADHDSIVNMIKTLTTAFNDTTAYIKQQSTAAASGNTGSVGRDPLVRGLRSQLTSVLTAEYEDGALTSLAEIGFEFSRTGELVFNESRFREALTDSKTDVKTLLRGSDGSGGVFGSLATAIDAYTAAGGFVPNAQDRLTTQLTQLSHRISDLEERLALRRTTLQREFAAADAAIAQLNQQGNSLSSLGSQYKLF
ncbi:MAG: flagellar filament capping protein FliD [Vicinamibacterales bacterium]